MAPLQYIDRQDRRLHIEKVYGQNAIALLYQRSRWSWLWQRPLTRLFAKNALFSRLYGWWQKQSFTRRKIVPFINNYQVDASEFLDDVDSFRSFNDFFIRRLKKEARPVASGAEVAVIPADGRYYFYQNIETIPGFIVKGEKFDLHTLLQDPQLAEGYRAGSMVIGRLCPSDYHRFHFPVDGLPDASKLINGLLYSVNPTAIKNNIRIFVENRRSLCLIHSPQFGRVAMIEVGATNVGTIRQTYEPGKQVLKGAEKGYFEFGGSALILLFEPGMIQFDADLIDAGARGLEIRCLMGQSMGKTGR